jgi:hypothetical protein
MSDDSRSDTYSTCSSLESEQGLASGIVHGMRTLQLGSRNKEWSQDADRVQVLMMDACNVHFKDIKGQFDSMVKQRGQCQSLDNWYIDECCDVFTGIMATVEQPMESDIVLSRMNEIFRPYVMSGYMSEESMFDHLSSIYMQYKTQKDSEDPLHLIEIRHGGRASRNM